MKNLNRIVLSLMAFNAIDNCFAQEQKKKKELTKNRYFIGQLRLRKRRFYQIL
jgi:hypothetical protein